jgi:hypothetical protein
MNKFIVQFLFIFSLLGYSQDAVLLDNVVEYDKKMNDLDRLVQDQRQKILRGDYGHSKEKKRRLLESLNKRAKIVGTGRTISHRQPFVEYLQSLGGELGEGKLPLNPDGTINENFKGRYSDYDLQCKPVTCDKIKAELLASGKFELRENNKGTFDIVAKNGTQNDMVKITFNVDDPDGKIISRKDKINNVETYTAVQIKQKFGDYQGNQAIEEALKAKEHAFKGGALNNKELLCFSHVCDEAFNTSTKTAYKLIKDAPSFVNDDDIQAIINKSGLTKENGSALSPKEFKKLLEDSYTGKQGKALISLEVNDIDAFLQARNSIVKQTVNKIEVRQAEIYENELTRLKEDLETKKISQKDFDNKMSHLTEINENLKEYSNNDNYKKITNSNLDISSSSPNINNLYQFSTSPTNQQDNLLQKGKNLNNRLTAELDGVDSSSTGKRIKIVNKAGMVVGFFDVGKMVSEHCSSAEVCAEVLATMGKEIAVETIAEKFISRGIPVFGQLKDSFDAGYFVGEQFNEHILGIKVKDCNVENGVEVCKDVAIRDKYIQNPLAEKMAAIDGTPENEKRAEFMRAAAKACYEYKEDLQAANKTCLDMTQDLTDSFDNEMRLKMLYLDLGILDFENRKQAEADKKALQEEFGCDFSIEGDCEKSVTNLEDQQGEDQSAVSVKPEEDKQIEVNDDWDSADEFDHLVQNQDNENASAIREQLENISEQSNTNYIKQITQTSKAISDQRDAQNAAARQAFGESMVGLANNLAAVRAEQQAADERFKQQVELSNQQTAASIAAISNQIQTNSQNTAACMGADGYPITDPYVCKELQKNSITAGNAAISNQIQTNSQNTAACMGTDGYPITDPYLCKELQNHSNQQNMTPNSVRPIAPSNNYPTSTPITQPVEIDYKCEGIGNEQDRSGCELTGEFSGASANSQKWFIPERKHRTIFVDEVCVLDFFDQGLVQEVIFGSLADECYSPDGVQLHPYECRYYAGDLSWLYETPSPSMPIVSGDDPIDVAPVIACFNRKYRPRLAREAIENNLSMVMDQYFKILEITAKKGIPFGINFKNEAYEWGVEKTKFMEQCDFVFNETISNIKSLILSRASESIDRALYSGNTPLRPVNANNGTAEWQLDEEAAIDFAILLAKQIADEVSREAKSEFFNKYNIDEDESFSDQLAAKNLFICGCESVRMEVQGALGFWDRSFFSGLRNYSKKQCEANGDNLSFTNNTQTIGFNDIKKEWKEYYGYD